MRILYSILILFFSLTLTSTAIAGTGNEFFFNQEIETDSIVNELVSFFDLRERESFIQVTNGSIVNQSQADEGIIVHVQIFNVDQDCNENNFFDVYTEGDTHVYNMRDIQTNDGNPSGVVLPEGAYGFVAVSQVNQIGGDFIAATNTNLFGNFRIIDNNGYEYRTNSQGERLLRCLDGVENSSPPLNFNFSNKNGVTLSDIVLITSTRPVSGFEEFLATDLTSAWVLLDVDIVNLNEVVFSCRDIITACTDQDNPRLEELLEFVADNSDGGANVAAFEWGINDAIPHSKGGELLCPGNNIEEGFVNLDVEFNSCPQPGPDNTALIFGFIGLNNGNGRGSMDSIWNPNNPLIETQF